MAATTTTTTASPTITASDEQQLLTFCTASVDLYARSIIDPATVSVENIQKEIQSFVSKMDKSKAMSVGKVLFCLELQYRNAAIYERFMSTKKKIEDTIEEVRIASATFNEGDSANQSPSAAILQEHVRSHSTLATLTNDCLKFYTSCFPLRHRVRYAPARLSLSPICSYKSDEFEIDAAVEYILLEKQPLKWKIQVRDKLNPTIGNGAEIIVPSLFFFIHWLTDDAESLQRLFDRSREHLASYAVSLTNKFRKQLKEAQFRSAFSAAQLSQLDSFVTLIPDDPEKVTKQIVIDVQKSLVAYLQRAEYPDMPEKEKPVIAILNSVMNSLSAFLSVPESVPDRSKVVFNRRLRIDGQKEGPAPNEKLVRIEWKMELVLNKCVTTTETTEIVPKHVDVDRFKQSEQELERKMVIQAVVDPATDTEISLSEAVQQGIVDYSTGTYKDHTNGTSMTIDEAIMRGMILVEFVAVQAGEEKLKNYGIVTVEDPANGSELHYVVHVAIDRKMNERLEFETAVERGILNLDNGTYWDSLENKAVPIADAIETGHLKGRKVNNLNELQELSKSQADIVKGRLKKLTSTMGILKGLGLRKT